MRRRFLLLCAAFSAMAALAITLRCNPGLAGATTETTNGVAGRIKNGDGTPASAAFVRLLPADYNPLEDSMHEEMFVDTVDTGGSYRFEKIAEGRYALIVRHRDSAKSAIVRDIEICGDSISWLPDVKLEKSGSIRADFSSGGTATGEYVYIPGTDIYSFIDNSGNVLLSDVPASTFSSIIFVSSAKEKLNILRKELTVSGGDTAIIEMPLWKHCRRLVLNTTASGAAVNSDVYGFPLLIRLNKGNFDFSQARPDGKDVIFTGKNNTLLPSEIERWDASAQRAEIWVKIDTVYGNDSLQFITMYWGNPAPSIGVSAVVVFDTADGFQGVWHLGDGGGGSTPDATVNRYHGMSPDNARPRTVEGAVGNCAEFNGVSNFIEMPNTSSGKLNFPEKGYYTVYAWVRLDTLDGASHCIVSKGYEQYYLRSTYITPTLRFSTPQWEFVEFGETDKWQPSRTPASTREWTLLVGVRRGEKQLLYCNGVLVDSTVDKWWNDVSRNTQNNLTIGKFAKPVTIPINEGYCYFKGCIDEVRIINRAQSSDWIKLCYMNQRSDDKLVVFR